jgi:hypothetical protein
MRKWNITVIHGDETKRKFAVGHVGSGVDWKGKQALVVGACTSAHDVSSRVSYHNPVIYLRRVLDFSRLSKQWCKHDHATTLSHIRHDSRGEYTHPPLSSSLHILI